MKRIIAAMICLLFTACSAHITEKIDLIEIDDVEKTTTVTIKTGDISINSFFNAAVTMIPEGLLLDTYEYSFSEYHVVLGQEVKEGDLLVSLNTDSLEKQIEALHKKVNTTIDNNKYENELKRFDIEIKTAEINKLISQKADRKTIESQQQILSDMEFRLNQEIELQKVLLENEMNDIAELEQTLNRCNLYAPYDCIVTYFPIYIQKNEPALYVSKPSDIVIEITDNLTESTAASNDTKNYYVINNDQPEVPVEEIKKITFPPNAEYYYVDESGDKVYLKAIKPSPKETILYQSSPFILPSRFVPIDEDYELKQGSYIQLVCVKAKSLNVICAPINVLHYSVELGDYVYVLENGVKTARQVVVGLTDAANAEIKEGVKVGDEVIVP